MVVTLSTTGTGCRSHLFLRDWNRVSQSNSPPVEYPLAWSCRGSPHDDVTTARVRR